MTHGQQLSGKIALADHSRCRGGGCTRCTQVLVVSHRSHLDLESRTRVKKQFTAMHSDACPGEESHNIQSCDAQNALLPILAMPNMHLAVAAGHPASRTQSSVITMQPHARNCTCTDIMTESVRWVHLCRRAVQEAVVTMRQVLVLHVAVVVCHTVRALQQHMQAVTVWKPVLRI